MLRRFILNQSLVNKNPALKVSAKIIYLHMCVRVFMGVSTSELC